MYRLHFASFCSLKEMKYYHRVEYPGENRDNKVFRLSEKYTFLKTPFPQFVCCLFNALCLFVFMWRQSGVTHCLEAWSRDNILIRTNWHLRSPAENQKTDVSLYILSLYSHFYTGCPKKRFSYLLSALHPSFVCVNWVAELLKLSYVNFLSILCMRKTNEPRQKTSVLRMRRTLGQLT